jgi:hypothetical protein
MSKIFIEENGIYQIDLSAAISAVGDLNEKYKTIAHILSDVDFIAETENEIFLIEYKNTDIEKANPDALKEKISNGIFYDIMVKKYYGSAFYVLACQKEKPINFICIIEASFLDSPMRKRMCASIKKRLPYELQDIPEITVNLINDFKVLSIQEWNEQYSIFPLTKYICK